MKKSMFLKIVCVVLTLVVFASMAMGCGMLNNASEGPDAVGSNNGGENKIETGGDKAEYSVGETSADTWTDSIGLKWVKVIIPVKNTGNTNLFVETSSVDI